jgi:hypothetical protein
MTEEARLKGHNIALNL